MSHSRGAQPDWSEPSRHDAWARPGPDRRPEDRSHGHGANGGRAREDFGGYAKGGTAPEPRGLAAGFSSTGSGQ